MRQCLECHFLYEFDRQGCDNCGHQLEHTEGIERYVDVSMPGGFDKRFFKDLAALEASNFWFKARNDLVASLISNYASNTRKYFEIGCGTGFVLERVSSELANSKIFASEYFSEGISYAKERVPRATFMQLDGRQIPFVKEFDLIGLYDVLEHIDDDELVLRELHKSLSDSGCLILTVPQHKWLWSAADEYAHHERRYTRRELHSKLEEAGFEVKMSSSFVVSLFPVLVLSRFFQRRKLDDTYDPLAEFRLPNWINKVLYGLLTFEGLLIGKGVRFPFGGSRVVVATKLRKVDG